jgi:Ca-activated chloride channel family protein
MRPPAPVATPVFTAALAIGLLLLPAGARSQAPAQVPRTPTFGTEVEIINLNLSVTDGRNRYVTDLEQKDFAVFEDGIRQELSLFTHENLPISLSVLLDTSASMQEKLPQARSAAIRFVKTLRPQDDAQIVQFNDRSTTLQDFTNDLALLEAAIHRTEAAGPTALYNSMYVALKELSKRKAKGELRRRALVVLSDGEDTASLVNDEQVLELARKSEIGIYPISLRPSRAQDRGRKEFSQAEHILTTLAHDTGGQVFFPQSLSELETVYERIAEELRTQYSLGYVSSNARRDGKWRRIVVRTPDRPGVQVRHKLGYYAPS